MKNLALRTVSGIVYIALIIGAILYGLPTIVILSAVFAILGVIEFSKLTNQNSSEKIPALLLDIVGVVALACGVYVYPILIWIFAMMLRLIVELYLKNPDPIKSLANSMFGQIYLGLPLMCLGIIASLYFSTTMPVLVMFMFIWISDTGAFIVGSLIGKNKLFERISPKKSWEGFFGGLAFNIAAAVALCLTCASTFGLPANVWIWIGLALIVTITATLGDLIESLLKRTANVKDSGNLIPGHGGILDRIDSLLLVAPATLLYLICIDIFRGMLM